MTQFAAKALSGKLIKYGLIAENQLEVYVYGLEILLSAFINILSVLVLSFMFSEPLGGVFFLLIFIPLRSTAGGYHAKNHWNCGWVFIIAFTVCMVIFHFSGAAYLISISPVIAVLSLVIVLWLSPVETKNKPLSEKQRKQNRIRSMILSLLSLVIALILFFLPDVYLKHEFACYFLGLATASISLVAAKIQNIIERS